MPTQIERGDGIRDSHLGEIEEWVDRVRLLREPSPDRLSDLVSDFDAEGAANKIRALFAPEIERFTVEANALPPIPGSGPSRLAGGRSFQIAFVGGYSNVAQPDFSDGGSRRKCRVAVSPSTAIPSTSTWGWMKKFSGSPACGGSRTRSRPIVNSTRSLGKVPK